MRGGNQVLEILANTRASGICGQFNFQLDKSVGSGIIVSKLFGVEAMQDGVEAMQDDDATGLENRRLLESTFHIFRFRPNKFLKFV